MFATLPYGQQLLGSPYWHVELPEASVCVAENREDTFLVLFTLPARAYDFVGWKAPGEQEVGLTDRLLRGTGWVPFLCREPGGEGKCAVWR